MTSPPAMDDAIARADLEGDQVRAQGVDIVVTPGSGNGRALATASRLRAALAHRGWSARLHCFQRFGDLIAWGNASEHGCSRLVAVGGDATISAAATAAIRHQVPLVPVPSGFGNLFAGTLGHSHAPEAAVSLIEEGQVKWVDVGVCRGELFLCHKSYGVLNDIQSGVEGHGAQPRSRLFRWLAYYERGLRLLTGRMPWAIRVDVDGATVATDAVLVTVANVPAYGRFLPLTPDASPTDGLLDVFLIRRATRSQLWARLFKLLLRRPTPGEDAGVRRGRNIAIETRGQRDEIRVMPNILPVLVGNHVSTQSSPDAARRAA